MGTHATRLERVLATECVVDFASFTNAEVRRQRGEARAEEDDLSFLRRVLHGRIDILVAEQTRRASGDPGSLVDRLAVILADAPPAGPPRSVRHVGVEPAGEPGEFRVGMEARLDELHLSDALSRPDTGLAEVLDALRGLEHEVSGLRVRVHTVEGRFAGDLGRRYRDGEATVNDLLQPDGPDGDRSME